MSSFDFHAYKEDPNLTIIAVKYQMGHLEGDQPGQVQVGVHLPGVPPAEKG